MDKETRDLLEAGIKLAEMAAKNGATAYSEWAEMARRLLARDCRPCGTQFGYWCACDR